MIKRYLFFCGSLFLETADELRSKIYFLRIPEGETDVVAGIKEEHSPLTTSDTLQWGSMLPMCLGWAGLVLPSKIKAVKKRRCK